MTQITDKKPRACRGGPVMRRTDSHVLEAACPAVSISGDQQATPVPWNDTLITYPDSDPRWGLDACEMSDTSD